MKIETKGSLWECIITSGCYSEWNSTVVVVSGNTYDEAKNALKIYYQENKCESEYDPYGLIFNDGEQWQYKECGDGVSWDCSYGCAENVLINRLDVIYSGDEIARKTL